MKNWEERIVFFGAVGYFSSFGEFGFGVWLYCCKGHPVAGSFGLGGQKSSRNPEAGDPDRILLDGWVVSRFWVGFGESIRQKLDKEAWRTTR